MVSQILMVLPFFVIEAQWFSTTEVLSTVPYELGFEDMLAVCVLIVLVYLAV